MLLEKAINLSKIHIKPIFIFTELLSNLEQLNISMPTYREFQYIISFATRAEEKRLENIVFNIPKNIALEIDNLLSKNDAFDLTSCVSLPKDVSNHTTKFSLVCMFYCYWNFRRIGII